MTTNRTSQALDYLCSLREGAHFRDLLESHDFPAIAQKYRAMEGALKIAEKELADPDLNIATRRTILEIIGKAVSFDPLAQ